MRHGKDFAFGSPGNDGAALAAGLFVIGLIVALVVSVAVVGYLTDGDISQ